MSANNSTPSPTSGARLHDEDDDNDLTEGLELGFDGAADLFRVWRQGMRPDPNLTVSEWADQHRWLSSRGAADPGRYRTARAPYLSEIMDALSPGHPAQRITFMKAAQVGGDYRITVADTGTTCRSGSTGKGRAPTSRARRCT